MMELETPAPLPLRRRRASSPKVVGYAATDADEIRTKRRRLTEPPALHADVASPEPPANPKTSDRENLASPGNPTNSGDKDESPFATLSPDLLLHVLEYVGVLCKRTMFTAVPAVCQRWRLACGHVRIDLDVDWATPCPRLFLFGNPARAVDILKIMRRFGGVRTIQLKNCHSINEHGIGRIMEAAAGPLTSLSLTNGSVSDATLSMVAKRWGGTLRHLGLGKTRAISDAGLKCVAKHCRRLESILLHDSGRVSDTGVVELLTSCPLLVELGLGGIGRVTDCWLDQIAAACPRLAAISLAKCHLVTDTGLGMLSAACPQLRSINLEATSNLTEAAMLALAAGCRELRSINLKNKCDLKDGVGTVTDAVLEKLGACCRSLRSINIMSSSSVTDAGVAKLAAGCTGLRWMAMSGCTMVTDAGVAALATHCSELEILFVGCCKITDAGLLSIATGCPRIHSLNLYNVTQVTEVGLRAVADGCPKVAWIRLPQNRTHVHFGRILVNDVLQDVAKGLFAPGAVSYDGAYPRPFPADLED